jgi:hypothetical protein
MPALFTRRASVIGIASLSLVWLCCTIAGLYPVAPVAQQKAEAASGLNHCGSPFAIADFDGDHLPDLAVVQVDTYGSRTSKYSIRVRFSGGEGAAIGIEAPLGGLRIDSRDVNGDDADDLIVSTAAESEIVAVLVNDGHGNFVVAKPGAFPNLERKQNCFIEVFGTQICDEHTLTQSRPAFGEEAVATAGWHGQVGAGLFRSTLGSKSLLGPIHSNLGRSPPTVVFA